MSGRVASLTNGVKSRHFPSKVGLSVPLYMPVPSAKFLLSSPKSSLDAGAFYAKNVTYSLYRYGHLMRLPCAS